MGSSPIVGSIEPQARGFVPLAFFCVRDGGPGPGDVLVLGALSVDFGCHFEPPFANPQVDVSQFLTPGEKSPKNH